MLTEEHHRWVRSAFGVDPGQYGAKRPPSALASAGGFLKGVGEGLLDGTKDMVVGVYDAGRAVAHEGYALATDAKERDRVGNAMSHGAQAVGEFADKAVHRPGEALDDVKHAARSGANLVGHVAHKVAEDYDRAAKEGHGAEFVGKGVGEATVMIASFFIPGGGEAKAAAAANDAAKIAKAAELAADAAKAAKAAELAADAAQVAKAAELAADAGKAAKAAELAADAAKAAKAADLAADAGKAAKGAELAADGGTVADAGKAAELAKVEDAARAIKIAERAGPPHPPKDYSALRAAAPDDFKGCKTFKPKGISEAQADAFLESPAGKAAKQAANAGPGTAEEKLVRLKTMLQSGGEAAPAVERHASPLVKIVPSGRRVGPTSAFFGTPEHLNEAVRSGKNLAEFFGLPASSESATYDVYLIVPKGEQLVMVNTVAPTVEFGGQVERAGGAIQHLVVDRSQWSAPKLIGVISN